MTKRIQVDATKLLGAKLIASTDTKTPTAVGAIKPPVSVGVIKPGTDVPPPPPAAA